MQVNKDYKDYKDYKYNKYDNYDVIINDNDLWDIDKNNYIKYDDLWDIINKKLVNKISYRLTNDLYYIVCDGHLITYLNYIKYLCGDTSSFKLGDRCIKLLIFRRYYGGVVSFAAVLDMITEPVTFILKPIFKPVSIIEDVFTFGLQLVIWFIEFVVWLIQFIIYVISDILNPANLVKDFTTTLFTMVYSIIAAVPQFIMAFIKMITNTFGSFVFNGFWGWDNVIDDATDATSNYNKKRMSQSAEKCYVTEGNGSVPFSVLLGTVICPPVGVFMTYGITGWINIILCLLLTLLYYFPGLLYALLIIYC